MRGPFEYIQPAAAKPAPPLTFISILEECGQRLINQRKIISNFSKSSIKG